MLIESIAQEIAADMIEVARAAPIAEPVQFVTGNSFMPPLRSYNAAEAIWQADTTGEHFERLTEELESILDAAKVLLDCPEYDNALYVVDLARFEYVEDNDSDSLQDDWAPITFEEN
jgi:Zn-dependent M32 family carboxypeptidase